jgi:hypothetical protein
MRNVELFADKVIPCLPRDETIAADGQSARGHRSSPETVAKEKPA